MSEQFIYTDNAYEALFDNRIARIKLVDSKPTLQFFPWDNDEIWLQYPKSQMLSVDGNKVVSNGMKWEAGDTLKWLFKFDKKPPTNTYSLLLGGNWQDFNFAYQKPFVNPTKYMEDGEEWLSVPTPIGSDHRPRKVDGSYAVYHRTKKDHVAGGTNYATGKALHIYVPRAIDVKGRSVWCILHIADGVYSVTIPQTFVDTAIYPIIVNDTFGYSTIATGSYSQVNQNFQVASGPYSPADNGTATSISAYIFAASGTINVTFGMWNDNGGVPGTLEEDTGEITGIDTTAAWETSNLDLGTAISSGSSYHLGMNHSGAQLRWWFDEDSFTEDAWYDADTYVGGTLQDNNPTSWHTNRRYSVYVTYTAGTPATTGFMTTNTGYWGY